MVNPLEQMQIREMPNARGACFGMVRNGGKRPHQGWDIYATVGTAIKAIATGKIVNTANSKGGYGKSITLEFTYGPQTLYAFYAHLSKVDVSEGDTVFEGQLIGETGITGNAIASAPHLHFEIRESASAGKGLGKRRDPSEILGGLFSVCNAPSTTIIFSEGEGMHITIKR